jgi:hypothetical protein
MKIIVSKIIRILNQMSYYLDRNDVMNSRNLKWLQCTISLNFTQQKQAKEYPEINSNVGGERKENLHAHGKRGIVNSTIKTPLATNSPVS